MCKVEYNESSFEKHVHEGRPLIIGVGGPVGSGKTTLIEKLCKAMSATHQIAVITNDIYTKEDAAILTRLSALEPERIFGVETGGCPHTAIRDDISANQDALDAMIERFEGNLDIIFLESGGDNLAASFSPELVEVEFYVIDVAGGEKIPRKGGPGIMRSDLLVINKIDLAPYVGASLEVMKTDTERMRGELPYRLTDLKSGTGLSAVIMWIEERLSQRNLSREALSLADCQQISAAPMASAAMKYDTAGRVAWDEMWVDFCDLALMGGPPHRGTMLESVSLDRVYANPDQSNHVAGEIARALSMVTALETDMNRMPGWIGLVCSGDAMAEWMARAIIAENVFAERDGATILLPAGPDFGLEQEIKNVVTAVAKTYHYWDAHRVGGG